MTELSRDDIWAIVLHKHAAPHYERILRDGPDATDLDRKLLMVACEFVLTEVRARAKAKPEAGGMLA